jgi:hypothetical protein
MKPLIFLILVCVICGISLEHLYRYQFRNADMIPNEGTKASGSNPVESNLIWRGGKRKSVTQGNQALVIDPRLNDYYISETPIVGLRNDVLRANGLEVTLDITLQSSHNFRAEYCLLCLVKVNTPLNKLDRCNDLDFGVLWFGKVITVITRNSGARKCNNIELPAPITNGMAQRPMSVTFRFINGFKELYINGKKSGAFEPPQNQSISNWQTEHTIWIGPVTPTRYENAIQLKEYKISIIKSGAPEIYVSEPIDGPISTQAPLKGVIIKSFRSTATTRSGFNGRGGSSSGSSSSSSSFQPCNLDDLDCYRHRQSPEPENHNQGRNTQFVETSYTSLGPVQKFETLEGFLDTELTFHVTSVNMLTTPPTTHGTDPLELGMLCGRGVEDSNMWTSRENIQGVRVYKKTMKLGDIYECITRIPRKNFTFESLSTQFNHLNTTVAKNEFFISTTSTQMPTAEKEDQIVGSVVIVQVYSNTTTPRITTQETHRHIQDNDLVISYRSCIPRYNYHENTRVELNSISRGYQGGPPLTLGAISQCAYDPSSMTCCYFWSLRTMNHYVSKNSTFLSELYLFFDVNGDRQTHHMLIVFPHLKRWFTSIPTTSGVVIPHTTTGSNSSITTNGGSSISTEHPPTPQTSPTTPTPPTTPQSTPTQPKGGLSSFAPNTLVACLYNDESMKIPYTRIRPHQQVFFKLQFVYDSLLHSGEFNCKMPPKCIIPELTLQLESISMCSPGKRFQAGKTCNELSGSLDVIMDLSDHFRQISNPDWKPEILHNHLNCGSAIFGRYQEARSGFLEISYDRMETGVIRTQSFHSPTARRQLNSYQTIKKGTNRFVSPILGECTDGLVLDDSVQDGYCVPEWQRTLGRLWIWIRLGILFGVIGAVISITTFIYKMLFPKRIKKSVIQKTPLLASKSGKPQDIHVTTLHEETHTLEENSHHVAVELPQKKTPVLPIPPTSSLPPFQPSITSSQILPRPINFGLSSMDLKQRKVNNLI